MYYSLTTTLSAKNQITLPAEFVRQLKLKPGMKLLVQVEGEHLLLTPKPDNIIDAILGSTKKLYGQTPEEADRFIREERASWGE